jgi:hypothetical protein
MSPWRGVRASVAGSAHLAHQKPCEDVNTVVLLPDGGLIAAVADGSSSAPRAREGAQCALDAATAHLARRLLEQPPGSEVACAGVLREAVHSACDALRALAGSAPLEELATTLLLTFVTDRWLGALQVGDGAVVYRLGTGQLQLATTVGHGEHINETFFLTEPEHVDNAHICVVPATEITGIVLCSDAIEQLCIVYEPRGAYPPFFSGAFELADRTDADLERFLASPRVTERTGDDKTLVILVRAP